MDATSAMRAVTKEEFFAVIGPKNVHPRIVSEWNNVTGYTQEWRLQGVSQKLIGKSSGTGSANARYWLT